MEYKHWIKYQTIGLGDIYDMLTKIQNGASKVLNKFFIWYLRNKYIFELMSTYKVEHP